MGPQETVPSDYGAGAVDSDQEELEWRDKLPPVPAVTSLLLRQQSRRRWEPESLTHMFAQLPTLQEVQYEPWREWDNPTQKSTGRGKLLLRDSPWWTFKAVPRFDMRTSVRMC